MQSNCQLVRWSFKGKVQQRFQRYYLFFYLLTIMMMEIRVKLHYPHISFHFCSKTGSPEQLKWIPRSQISLKGHYFFNPFFMPKIFTVTAELKALSRTPSVTDAKARTHIKGVNNIFSNQFGISRLPETSWHWTGLMKPEFFIFWWTGPLNHSRFQLLECRTCCFSLPFMNEKYLDFGLSFGQKKQEAEVLNSFFGHFIDCK